MKFLLRHLITDLACGVELASYFSCMDMIEALNGTVGNVSSYLDYGYFGVLGADFDSDTVLLTDNQILIRAAKRNYYIFKIANTKKQSNYRLLFYIVSQFFIKINIKNYLYMINKH